MSRSDDERVADILEAAAEVAAITGRGRAAWDADRIGRNPAAGAELPDGTQRGPGRLTLYIVDTDAT